MIYMQQISYKNFSFSLVLITTLFLNAAMAQVHSYTSENPYYIEYWNESSDRLNISIRYSGVPDEIDGSLKVANLPEILYSEGSEYPKEGDKTAVLFLVDVSSDLARRNVIKKNIEQLQKVLATRKEHQIFGLATFGEKLKVLSPIGSNVDEITTKSNEIGSNENETLLYQHIGGAIDLLNKQDVKRRVLIVFSDGNAEDNRDTYNKQTVIEKANKKSTIIIGLAFPPKSGRGHIIRNYQVLSSLAKATGGIFSKANEQGDLSGDILLTLLDSTDNGGYWSFPLTSLEKAGMAIGNVSASLIVKKQNESTDIPIVLKFPKVTLNSSWTKTQQIVAIAGMVLLVLGLLLYLLKRKKPEAEVIYAYIDSLDGNNRYNINKKTFKIGRNSENDLVLVNNTVSSFHAQINITRDEEFIITDLQSANGIIINESEKRIKNATLYDNDLMIMGEVRLQFISL